MLIDKEVFKGIKVSRKNIRNFCIIAHVDHGKSTLADQFLKICQQKVSSHEQQVLDNMPLEKERGITIKLSSCQLYYRWNEELFLLNLIDTPGHVDFHSEVIRSLAACEGAILLVDAIKGIEAQTLANFNVAQKLNLKIIPVINKIDLLHGDELRKQNLVSDLSLLVGCKAEDVFFVSAKTGLNVNFLIKKIIKILPFPETKQETLKALVFDSYYDRFQGVTFYVRIFSGKLFLKQEIKLLRTKKTYQILNLGINLPTTITKSELCAGEVGWITANIKELDPRQIGETITEKGKECSSLLFNYQFLKPVVYCGIYPLLKEGFGKLWDSLTKLHLSDVSFTFNQENSLTLGQGVRCGFSGILHMEIIKERLKREYQVEAFLTTPTTTYEVKLRKNNELIVVNSQKDFPETNLIAEVREQFAKVTITTPHQYFSRLLTFSKQRRGFLLTKQELSGKKSVMLILKFPLSEIITDFHTKLKTLSSGYATFDYEILGFEESDLVKVKILTNNQEQETLSLIVYRGFAYEKAKKIVSVLRDVIPRANFEIVIQAKVEGRIVAREQISALKKNVTGNLYGGDITRKMKLWKKQKRGKERLKAHGNVNLSPQVFLKLFSL